MFTATLLFCLYTGTAAPQCGTVADTEHVFKTEAECQVRAKKIEAVFDEAIKADGFPGFVVRQATCKKLPKSKRI